MTDQPKQPARKRKPAAKQPPAEVIDTTASDAETPIEETPTETVEETAPDFLDGVHASIKARMEELRPHVEEYDKLVLADRALGGEPNKGGRPRTR